MEWMKQSSSHDNSHDNGSGFGSGFNLNCPDVVLDSRSNN